jgi:hypothetical protein
MYPNLLSSFYLFLTSPLSLAVSRCLSLSLCLSLRVTLSIPSSCEAILSGRVAVVRRPLPTFRLAGPAGSAPCAGTPLSLRLTGTPPFILTYEVDGQVRLRHTAIPAFFFSCEKLRAVFTEIMAMAYQRFGGLDQQQN